MYTERCTCIAPEAWGRGWILPQQQVAGPALTDLGPAPRTRSLSSSSPDHLFFLNAVRGAGRGTRAPQRALAPSRGSSWGQLAISPTLLHRNRSWWRVRKAVREVRPRRGERMVRMTAAQAPIRQLWSRTSHQVVELLEPGSSVLPERGARCWTSINGTILH